MSLQQPTFWDPPVAIPRRYPPDFQAPTEIVQGVQPHGEDRHGEAFSPPPMGPLPTIVQGGPQSVQFEDPVFLPSQGPGGPSFHRPRDVHEPRKHPLEDPPYAFRRSPGVGHMGGGGPEEASESWLACSNAVREYDEKLVTAWRSEMDTTLVFAGLFSAIVTACVLESYQWLSEDPQDQSAVLLAKIADTLHNGATPSSTESDFSPSSFHITINALWFLSLVITLHAVLMAILVKQWLTEYTWTIGSKVSTPHQTATLRQLRFEGLTEWRIPQIITYLPTQLILAVFLFLVGLLCLLWELHVAVAIPTTIMVGLSTAYLLVTSVVPTVYPACGYKSAQAWLVHRIARAFGSIWRLGRRGQTDRSDPAGLASKTSSPRGWTDAALRYLEDQRRRMSCDVNLLSWVYSSLTSWDPELVSKVWNCALDLPVQGIHPLICRLANLHSGVPQVNGQSTDADVASSNDPEKGGAKVDAQSPLQDFERSLQMFFRKVGEDNKLGKEELFYKIYAAYIEGLSFHHNSAPDTLWGASTSDSDIAEYITAFRVLHLHFLPARGKGNGLPADLERVWRGNKALYSLLDEGTVAGARVAAGSETLKLRGLICDDIRTLSRKNWGWVDMAANVMFRPPISGGGNQNPSTNNDIPAVQELDSLISATLCQLSRSDAGVDMVVSLVESTLLMSRRIRKTEFEEQIAERVAQLLKGMLAVVDSKPYEASDSFREGVEQKWVPLLRQGTEYSVVEEWDLTKAGLAGLVDDFLTKAQESGSKKA